MGTCMPEDHIFKVDPLPTSAPVHDNWLRSHAYLAACGGAAILILAGAIVVERKSAVAPQNDSGAWGGAGTTLLNPTAYGQKAPQTVLQQPTGGTNVTLGTYDTAPDPETGVVDNSFDFNEIIAELSKSSRKKPAGSSVGSSVDTEAWAYIPSGLISTSTVVVNKTETQQKLYDYGNEAGSYIESFEETHRNEVQVLKDFIEDRLNAQKVAQFKDLSKALANIGTSLERMDVVPTAAKAAHIALAESYKEIGAKLALIADTQSDQEFLSAINAYNASADTFAKRYVALSTVFTALGVKFSPEDSGSVFMFSNAGRF